MHGVFTLLAVYCIQVLKCRMTRPRNSAHQCLVTKINMTILKFIRNPIFKEQSFECMGVTRSPKFILSLFYFQFIFNYIHYPNDY